MNTARLGDIASEAYNDISLTVNSAKDELVQLESWMDKKQNAPPYKWMKRWVVVKDAYLLWSDRKISVENGVTAQEKLRWNRCIGLEKIENVKRVNDKYHRMLRFTVKGMKREFVWRAPSKKIRDKWLRNLDEHIQYTKRAAMFSIYEE